MEYNSTREKLIIPEYGRNVQKLIAFTKTLEKKEERTAMANLIVNIMAQMNPHVRDSSDYRRKLWDHMFIISGYDLDVDSPFPMPSPDALHEKPQPVGYKGNNIQFRHYGKNIELIIDKAIAYEEGPEKDALIKTIANHLKKSYINWNRDSVNDTLIEQHLEGLSDGKLKLKEDMHLTSTSDILARTRRKKHTKPGYNNGGRDNNNHRRRKPQNTKK